MEGSTRVSIFWKKLGLVLYASVLLVIFVYLRFPYNSIKAWIEDDLSSLTGRQVEVEKIGPSLVPGLRLSNVKVNNKALFDCLLLRPSPLYLVHGNLAVGIKAWSKAGYIRGDIQIPVKGSSGSLKIDLSTEGLDISGFSQFLSKVGKVKGKIDGSISMKGTRGQFYRGSGKAHLLVSDLSLPLMMPMIPIGTIKLKHGTMDVHITRGTVVIDKCVFNGPIISGSLGGQLRLNRYISRSRLSVTGDIKFATSLLARIPLKAYLKDGKLKFTLTGTLRYPRYRIITG